MPLGCLYFLAICLFVCYVRIFVGYITTSRTQHHTTCIHSAYFVDTAKHFTEMFFVFLFFFNWSIVDIEMLVLYVPINSLREVRWFCLFISTWDCLSHFSHCGDTALWFQFLFPWWLLKLSTFFFNMLAIHLQSSNTFMTLHLKIIKTSLSKVREIVNIIYNIWCDRWLWRCIW